MSVYGYGYRRGSIFWALTLIGVGSIFLYQNFNPSVQPWHIIAKFWPILIIFWGLSKLIDFIQAQAHPETTPPPLFSGSEVVLLILILLMGTMVSHFVLHPNWRNWVGFNDDDFSNIFLNSYTYSQSLSQSVKPQPHLVLEDERGDVEIRASDKPIIEATVKEVIRTENEEEARKIADQLKVEIVEQTAGYYALRSNRRSLSGDGSRISLDITLSVPKATSTEITSDQGDTTLAGLQGDQTVTSLHGDLHLSAVEGLVRVHKTGGLTEVRDVKGNVEVDGRGSDLDVGGVTGTVTVNGDFSGTLQFRNVIQTLRYTSSRTDLTTQRLAGRLSMETGSLEANDVDGPFEITTKQKDITLENFKHSVKITNTNGDVQLRTSVPPTHPIDINLGKGEIQLDIPPASNFQIDATSRHGDVESDFPSLKVVKEGDTPSISGTNGKGGPSIHLVTSYGTIRLGHQAATSVTPPSLPTPPIAPREPGHEKTAWRGQRARRYDVPLHGRAKHVV
ncbi:MAG: DUF4097 family beta strand repeat-containing protein [Terriglobia bacterium]|jgi:hypothetical protein